MPHGTGRMVIVYGSRDVMRVNRGDMLEDVHPKLRQELIDYMERCSRSSTVVDFGLGLGRQSGRGVGKLTVTLSQLQAGYPDALKASVERAYAIAFLPHAANAA